jgi:hypothetical protein
MERILMYKLFTLEQATQLIPQVKELVLRLQGAMQEALKLKENLARLDRHSVAAFNTTQEIHFLFRIACDCNSQLNALGVVLEDIEAGIVNFPSQQGGEVVHLTWKQGDETISGVERLMAKASPYQASA